MATAPPPSQPPSPLLSGRVLMDVLPPGQWAQNWAAPRVRPTPEWSCHFPDGSPHPHWSLRLWAWASRTFLILKMVFAHGVDSSGSLFVQGCCLFLPAPLTKSLGFSLAGCEEGICSQVQISQAFSGPVWGFQGFLLHHSVKHLSTSWLVMASLLWGRSRYLGVNSSLDRGLKYLSFGMSCWEYEP